MWWHAETSTNTYTGLPSVGNRYWANPVILKHHFLRPWCGLFFYIFYFNHIFLSKYTPHNILYFINGKLRRIGRQMVANSHVQRCIIYQIQTQTHVISFKPSIHIWLTVPTSSDAICFSKVSVMYWPAIRKSKSTCLSSFRILASKYVENISKAGTTVHHWILYYMF